MLFFKKNKGIIRIEFSYLIFFFFCPNITLDNDQVILPNIVQDVVLVQDNNEVLSEQDNIDQVILHDIV